MHFASHPEAIASFVRHLSLIPFDSIQWFVGFFLVCFCRMRKVKKFGCPATASFFEGLSW
jgi:hypothetical protein